MNCLPFVSVLLGVMAAWAQGAHLSLPPAFFESCGSWRTRSRALAFRASARLPTVHSLFISLVHHSFIIQLRLCRLDHYCSSLLTPPSSCPSV